MSRLRPTDLQMRARLALTIITTYIDAHPLHQAPPHSVLLERINAKLPPKLSRGRIVPVLTSKEQSYRLAEQLREAGLLVSAPGMQFNMVPTDIGRHWSDQWFDDVDAWVRDEQTQWRQQGKKEATRKLVGRSEHVAV